MSFFTVLKQEINTIFRDATIVLTIIGGVLLYAFLYPQPYLKQNVTAIPIALVDHDRSDISKEIAFALHANPQIGDIFYFGSAKEAIDALNAQKIKAYIEIPYGFKRDLLLLERPTIKVGIDGSYFLIFGGVAESAMLAILTQGAKQNVANLLKEQVPLKELKSYLEAFSFEMIELYNPNNSYTQYVLPAVFVLILQQTLLIGLGIVGGGVNERAYRNYDYNAPTLYVMVARYMIFLGLFAIHMMFYFGFVFDLFGIFHVGDVVWMVLYGFFFLSAVIAFGLFFGSIMPQREIATPLVLFSSIPLIFSVGFVWPKEMIPSVIVDLSYLFPSTVGIDGFLALNQLGASLGEIGFDVVVLLLQTVTYATAAFLVMRYKKQRVM